MDLSAIKFYKSYEDFDKAKKDQRVILATTKAKEAYINFKFKKNDTLLFGRESTGVPEELHKSIKYKIKIPMIENKRSLNLATSAAIIVSESLNFAKLNLTAILLSFIFSFVTIKYFLKYIKKFNLNIFVFYRIILGFVLLYFAYL